MKKRIGILLFLVFAAAVFAQGFSISAGAGGIFDYGHKNGIKDDFDAFIGYRNLSYGACVFFEAAYLGLTIMYVSP